MFLQVLFVITSNWKQHKYLSLGLGGWITTRKDEILIPGPHKYYFIWKSFLVQVIKNSNMRNYPGLFKLLLVISTCNFIKRQMWCTDESKGRNWSDAARSQLCQKPTETEISKEAKYQLEYKEGGQPCWHCDFSPMILILCIQPLRL